MRSKFYKKFTGFLIVNYTRHEINRGLEYQINWQKESRHTGRDIQKKKNQRTGGNEDDLEMTKDIMQYREH